MKKILSFLICFFAASSLMAQQFDLYTPLEFQEAYKKGTRSIDGKPGSKYWHNTVDYTISVSVDPQTRGIKGKETVTYKNNSPDDLGMIVIRLYYDVFKKGNKRAMQVNPEDISEGVEISRVAVNGNEYDLNKNNQVRRGGTNMSLLLQEPLKPGGKVTIDLSWEQKVPLTVRRTGAKDSTSYFIAYWYPQVAVYDDIFGWDDLDYTFATEFYNNLGNYDVKITAPDNFLVWATGELQNSTEVLPDKILTKYKSAKTSTETVHVVDGEDLKALKLKSGTWHYKASEVSDFAFAMSDHYQWDAANQVVDGRNVLISSAFPSKDAAGYGQLTAVQQKTMKHFSEDFPGIPYPYPAFTTFIGLNGGGMEFPMMANNDGPRRGVTIHEMYHTYFPMYVRINERRWAWMDEGWADFVTAITEYKFFQDPKSRASLLSSMAASMQGMAGHYGDLPTGTSSQFTSDENYGYQSYPLPSFTYAMLYTHLGEEKFLKCYQEYIRRWAKKSPTPYDFFNTFENVSGEDLNWFWNSWYFNHGYADLGIESFDKGTLTVRKIGNRPVPVTARIEYNDGSSDYQLKGPGVWKDGSSSFKWKLPNGQNVKSVTLNHDVADVDQMNNFYPSLPDRYKKIKLPAGIEGDYTVKQFPVVIQLSKQENGVLHVAITNTGIASVLLPTDDSKKFVSVDGNMTLTFSGENAVTDVVLTLANFGVTVNGTKK